MTTTHVDVVLVGAGTMSATLGVLLRALDPTLNILMVESLDGPALESSDAWNNAGTGHAGYCELNYTPQLSQDQVDIAKALSINSDYEMSLQLWSWLVQQGHLPESRQFINRTPHLSFVWGDDNVAFLQQRWKQLSATAQFADMVWSTDAAQLSEWMPLVMRQRAANQPIAATRVAYGTDVDFGALTRHLIQHLQQQEHFELRTNTRVRALKQRANGSWRLDLDDLTKDHLL